MKKRSFGQFWSGAVLGGALALAGVAWSHSGESGEGGMNGMMDGGSMMGMHKMMEQCGQMMEDMKSQHQGQQPGGQQENSPQSSS